jgi:hypothetical protein
MTDYEWSGDLGDLGDVFLKFGKRGKIGSKKNYIQKNVICQILYSTSPKSPDHI